MEELHVGKDYDIKQYKKIFINRLNQLLDNKNNVTLDQLGFLKSNYAEEIKDVIEEADRIIDGCFVFSHKWAMEKTHIPYRFKRNKIDWCIIPFGDPEWCYMFNRHRFLQSLGEAFLLTNNEKYAKRYFELLEDWIDNNPNSDMLKNYTWRSLEAGLRCKNWLISLGYFIDSRYLTDNLLKKIIDSLIVHGKYLASDFSNFKKTSNWGVIENHGLFILSMVLQDINEYKHWQKLSIDRLIECCRLQIYKDGVHWEQSSTYHNEVLQCLLDVIKTANNYNFPIDDSIISSAKNMSFATMYMATPNYNQLINGDSDNVNVCDLLAKAAYILKDSNLKSGGSRDFGYSNIMHFGFKSIEKYRFLASTMPKQLSYAFEDSGNYIMRSSWNEDALYLSFDCGSMGGGHGHADMFHINLSAYGKDFLVDSGRYTYSDDNLWREYFKKCSAHNTTIVDETDFSQYKETWVYSKVARPILHNHIFMEEVEYFEGSHDGYSDLPDPVFPNRKVIYVKNKYWLLIDSFFCNGRHKYEQYFNFADKDIQLDEESMICSTSNIDSANLTIVPHVTPHIDLHATMNEEYRSPEYNKKVKNSRIKYLVRANGFVSLINVLVPSIGKTIIPITEHLPVFNRNGKEINCKNVQGLKITFQEIGEEYLFVIVNKSVNNGQQFFIIDDIMVFGDLVMIKRCNNNEEIIRIK